VSVNALGTHLSSIPSVGLSVCQSVWKVYCGKTADWIWMPFGVMSGVGQGMGVLDGVLMPQGEGEVLVIFCSHWFE